MRRPDKRKTQPPPPSPLPLLLIVRGQRRIPNLHARWCIKVTLRRSFPLRVELSSSALKAQRAISFVSIPSSSHRLGNSETLFYNSLPTSLHLTSTSVIGKPSSPSPSTFFSPRPPSSPSSASSSPSRLRPPEDPARSLLCSKVLSSSRTRLPRACRLLFEAVVGSKRGGGIKKGELGELDS